MHAQKLFGLALFGTLALGCGNSNPTTLDMAKMMDMAVTGTADMAMQAADMAVASDMATVFNSCTGALYSDQSAAGGNRTVLFGAAGNTYVPACITIAVGQTVTFSGTFANHPMRPGVGANATAGSAGNPITATNTGISKPFTFATAGIYPYNCSTHDGMGMNGVVQVK